MHNRIRLLLTAFVLGCALAPGGYADPRPQMKGMLRQSINVAVFKGLGGDAECISDAFEALKIDPAIQPEILGAAGIMNGELDRFDAVVFPGGGGARQMGNLGHLGQQKLLDFVKSGNGLVGLCAGAYMLSNTPNYACFHLGGFEAIDMEHDERGNGMVRFSCTQPGLVVFPELKGVDDAFLHYFEGPVLVPAKGALGTTMAVMHSDVHLKNNAPANMTNGKAFFVSADAGRGRVFLSVGHPENTPGMRWILPRMVRWTLRKELVPYAPEVVRVKRNNKEVLFDAKLKAREKACFDLLMPANEDVQKKLGAISELLDMRSWGAKERLEGCLRDKVPAVRAAAAEALVDLEHTAATKDVKAAAATESDPAIKARIEKCAKALSDMTHGR